MNARRGLLAKTLRQRVVRSALALLSVCSLLAAGTFGQSFAVSAQQRQQQKAQAVRLSDEQRILHVLNRLGFGARPGDVERVRAMGLDRYIEQQLHPETLSDTGVEAKLQRLDVLHMTTAELYEKFPQPGQLLRRLEREGKLPPELAAMRDNKGDAAAPAPAMDAPASMPLKQNEAEGTGEEKAAAGSSKKDYRQAVREYYMENNLRPPQQIIAELQASRILRAVYSERQLQEAMVDFWTNHFNVFAGKGADRWLLVSYDRDTIRPHAMGKFYDLLLATAQSPAMLFYLDNFQSISPNAQMNRGRGLRAMMGQPGQQPQQQKRAKRGINENYARELMELHTLGVDGGYTQKDVQEVARCFTGWTIFAPRGAGARLMGGDPEDAGKFYFNQRLHDDGEKVVLGHKIPAGGGMKDGLMVLEILAHHPATAKHLALQLSQRFVSDNPSPALVERVAAAYTKSDGDIRETLRAIFTSPEFNAPESYRAKIKQPFELTVSAIRALGGETNGGPAIQQWIARMGQPLYGYQTPNGYADVAASWVNTGALLERLNFGLALAANRIPGTRVNLDGFANGAGGNSAAATEAERARILDRFVSVILQGQVSPATRQTLLTQLAQPLPAQPAGQAASETAEMGQAGEMRRVGPRAARRGMGGMGEVARGNLMTGAESEVTKIVGLILGSPEFQRQ